MARALDKELTAQIARGEDPAGNPWQLTKKGEKPLRRAARGLTVKAIGSVILARLTGNSVRHHLGSARGRIRRQVLPSSKLTATLTKAITRVVRGEFRAAMK